MDFSKILPILLTAVKDPAKLADVLKWYEKNQEVVSILLRILGELFSQDHPVVPPTPVPVPGPVPTPTPVPTSPTPVVTALRGSHKYGTLYFCEKGSEPGELYNSTDFEKIVNGGSGMVLKDRMHLDVDPIGADGNKIHTGDPRIVNFKKPDGAPAIEWRWLIDGRMNWNSADEEDHFNLESYDDADNGCTPVLRLEAQSGPGIHKVEVYAVILAEFNNGLYVEGPHDFFYVD